MVSSKLDSLPVDLKAIAETMVARKFNKLDDQVYQGGYQPIMTRPYQRPPEQVLVTISNGRDTQRLIQDSMPMTIYADRQQKDDIERVAAELQQRVYHIGIGRGSFAPANVTVNRQPYITRY